MRQDFSQILEECLHLMQAGTPMEECLKRFPEQAAELQPRLAMAHQFSQTQPVSPPHGAFQHGKDHLMAALTERQEPRALSLLGVSLRFPMPLRQALAPLQHLSLPYRLAAAAAAVFLMAGAMMGSAAAGDPGSPLRSWFSSGSNSSVSVSASTPSPTPTPTATAVPTPEAEIKGAIESVGDGTFVVGGVTVVVTADTRFDEFDGQLLAAGQRVEVHGVLQNDGSVLATRVELEDDDDADADVDDDDGDDEGDDDSTVTPTSTPDDDDAAEDDDANDDDADDDDSTVTPTSTPDDDDAAEDDDANDDDADDDDSTVTPTSSPDDDNDDEGDDSAPTPDDHNGDEDGGDND